VATDISDEYFAGIVKTIQVVCVDISRGGSVDEWLACWTQARKVWVQIAAATLSGNSLRQTVQTHRDSVHEAATLLAALLRVAEVTAGLTESNGSLCAGFMTHVTCRLTVKNRDQLRNPKLDYRVWATFTFLRFELAYFHHNQLH